VRAWSHLIFEADQKSVPKWIMAPALAHLGFRDKLDRPPPFFNLHENELREFRAWADPTRPQIPAALFILHTPGIVPDEAPSASARCLAVESRLYPSFSKKWMDWVRDGLEIRTAIVEMHEDGSTAIEAGTRPFGLDVFYVCSAETDRRLGTDRPAPAPRIVEPKSYADAVMMTVSPEKVRKRAIKK
jgi:hypothetical protein